MSELSTKGIVIQKHIDDEHVTLTIRNLWIPQEPISLCVGGAFDEVNEGDEVEIIVRAASPHSVKE